MASRDPTFISLTSAGNWDDANCAREPIHVPGAIQPHGCLLVADPETGFVRQASANTASFLGARGSAPIGRHLADILPSGLADAAAAMLRLAEGASPRQWDTTLGDDGAQARPGVVSAHRNAAGVVLEIEDQPPLGNQPAMLFRGIEGYAERLRGASSDGVLEAVMAEVASWTGYPRVMVLTFDADWNGEVIAERLAGDVESYEGHRFPAKDIPAQARQLYTVNTLRHTPDVGYTPVPMTADPAAEAPESLDMTWCALRSVSPVHRAYMRNMNLGASLSLSLMVDGRLWGLVLAHAFEAHRVPPRHRAYLQLVGQLTGDALQVALKREAEDAAAAITADLAVALRDLDDAQEANGLLAALEACLDLPAAFEAEAAVIWLHGEVAVIGRPVPEGLAETVIPAVAEEALEGAVVSDAIGERIPDFAPVERRDWVAGFLYTRLAADRLDGLLFLRPERVRRDVWAGDPSATAAPADSESAQKLTPRESFEAWVQEVAGRSHPWEAAHRLAADRLVRWLARYLVEEVARLTRQMVNYDALTGLPNRRLLADRMAHAIRGTKRRRETLAVLFMDLDGFKPINDQYGHDVGDTLLRAIAARVSGELRKADTVARVGGDEFILLLGGFSDTAEATRAAEVCAQRVRAAIEALRDEPEGVPVSCSMGIALYPDDGASADTLIHAADQAMYSVKHAAGPRYAFAGAVATP